MSKRYANIYTEPDFDKAFPAIATLDMHIIMASQSGADQYRIGRSNYRDYITCNNSCCHYGVLYLAGVLGSMISKRQTHAEGSTICPGVEGSPKGRKMYRKCLTEFSYTVDIEYKVIGEAG